MRSMRMQWEPSDTSQDVRERVRNSVVQSWGNVPYTFTQNHDDDSILIQELEDRIVPNALTDNMVRAFTEKVRAEYEGMRAERLEIMGAYDDTACAKTAVYHCMNVLHDEARTGIELLDKYIQEYLAL